MANDYFQFKQFTVYQKYAAMKVCTDSCLFGAWVTNKIQQNLLIPKTILDIGTGTGLLSLMLAQKTMVNIDAIDIDKVSCDEAINNFSTSPWSDRLQVFHADIKECKPILQYDLAICNPPFFENDLLPGNEGKITARHSSALRLEDLLLIVKKLLADNGYLAILLPYHRSDWFINIAQSFSLFVNEQVDIRQTSNHKYFRSMFILQRKKSTLIKDEMSIKDNGNEYTKEFTELLKDYYLYL